MEIKRLSLEELFKKIRKLEDEYKTEEFDSEIFILENGSEEKSFAKDLLEITTDYLKMELNFDETKIEEDEEEIELFEDDSLEEDDYLTYYDEDDEDVDDDFD